MFRAICLCKDIWTFLGMMTHENDPRITMNPKLSNATVVKFSINFVDTNVEKGQQGKNLLSSSLSDEMNAAFQVQNVSN